MPMIPSVNDRDCSLSQEKNTDSPLSGTDDDTELRAISIDQWQEFAQDHPERLVFHHRAWIELLMKQYGMECRIPAVVRGGEIVAAAPFLKTRSLSWKRKYVSLPFTDYVHPLVSGEQSRDELRSAIAADPVLRRSRAVIIRTDKALVDPPSMQGHWLLHQLDISRPIEQVEKGFDRRLKQHIRKAEKNQLRFATSTDADAMEIFYRLQLATRHKLGVPVQPRSFFRQLQQNVIAQGLGFVGLVYKDDAPISGGVFLGDNHLLFVKYLASDPSALDLSPNEHLVYQALKHAVAQGYRTLDWGICRPEQEGLRRFKKKWGSAETEVYQENVLGAEEHFGQDSALLKVVEGVIRRSPPVVCELIGELFYRFSY